VVSGLKEAHDAITYVLDNEGMEEYGRALHAARYAIKEALAILEGKK